VPVLRIETKQVEEIAAELDKLARTLRAFAQGTEGSRSARPAGTIVKSLGTVNRTLEAAARRGSLGPAGFARIGREFEKIGATLRALGSDSKTSK